MSHQAHFGLMSSLNWWFDFYGAVAQNKTNKQTKNKNKKQRMLYSLKGKISQIRWNKVPLWLCNINLLIRSGKRIYVPVNF